MKLNYHDDSETTSKWSGCYDSGWQGEITPESFSHPAKFSRALIRRIYEHAFEQGWLYPGDVVLDPFGGVALGALNAMWNRLAWVGVELEPKFVKLGEQNIALWQRKYGSKAGFGSARIIQGDLRRLAEVIAGVDLVCSSPPYAGNEKSDYLLSEDGKTRRRDVKRGYKQGHGCFRGSETYGQSPGQLGAMKEGDFDCVVSSPPFSQAQSGGGINKEKIVRQKDGRVHALGNNGYNSDMQGETPGQLASLPEGRFEAVISSPPYEGSQLSGIDTNPERLMGGKCAATSHGGGKTIYDHQASDGNIGSRIGPTFWSAAREIVAQCHAILKPGGHAIWVCKDFVRAKKRVPFSDQWQALCESQGFRLVCRHRAMLVANHGEQETIFGGIERLTTERKSFFRRLAEKKGNPRIDHEDVMCLERVLL